MNGCKGGLPKDPGVVPIMFESVSLLCSWVMNCEILCVRTKQKLVELIGPLCGLVFYVNATQGEIEKEVCLKLIGEVWTVTVFLFHWPKKGAAVPQMLLFPVHGMSGKSMRGEGGKVVWNEENRQSINRFSVTRTTRIDLMLRKHLGKLHEACTTPGCALADEKADGPIADVALKGTGGEGALRAALAAAQGASESCGRKETEGGGRKTEGGGLKAEAGAGPKTEGGGSKIKVIRDGVALDYDGKVLKFGGEKRWADVRKLIEADGEYVELAKGLKSRFSHNDDAVAFFEAAVKAEGQGSKGTHRYRLKK